jgi:hypothetical protein
MAKFVVMNNGKVKEYTHLRISYFHEKHECLHCVVMTPAMLKRRMDFNWNQDFVIHADGDEHLDDEYLPNWTVDFTDCGDAIIEYHSRHSIEYSYDKGQDWDMHDITYVETTLDGATSLMLDKAFALGRVPDEEEEYIVNAMIVTEIGVQSVYNFPNLPGIKMFLTHDLGIDGIRAYQAVRDAYHQPAQTEKDCIEPAGDVDSSCGN